MNPLLLSIFGRPLAIGAADGVIGGSWLGSNIDTSIIPTDYELSQYYDTTVNFLNNYTTTGLFGGLLQKTLTLSDISLSSEETVNTALEDVANDKAEIVNSEGATLPEILKNNAIGTSSAMGTYTTAMTKGLSDINMSLMLISSLMQESLKLKVVEVASLNPDTSLISPTINVAPAQSVVNVAPAEPVINVSSTAPTVNVAPAEPVINVSSTAPTVNVASAEPVINVSSTAPTVNVAPAEPVINVSSTAPTVNVSSTAPTVNVAPAEPVINVSSTAPTVNVAPSEAVVNVAPTLGLPVTLEDNLNDVLGLQKQSIPKQITKDDLKIESLEYIKTDKAITDLDGQVMANVSPREIANIKNVSDARVGTDTNNFELDDDDFDIMGIPDISSIFQFQTANQDIEDLYNNFKGGSS